MDLSVIIGIHLHVLAVKIYTIDKFDDENIRSIGVHLCLSAVNKRYLKGKVTWAKLLVLI